jgi:hypothetical protein
MGQHPEGRGQQSVSSKNRRRLVELLVAGRSAAAQIAIVHRRQVVMNEGISMDHLDRCRYLQGAPPGDPKKPRTRQDKERPQPFPGRQGRVAHRIVDPGFETGGHDQKSFQRGVGELGGLVQSA